MENKTEIIVTNEREFYSFFDLFYRTSKPIIANHFKYFITFGTIVSSSSVRFCTEIKYIHRGIIVSTKYFIFESNCLSLIHKAMCDIIYKDVAQLCRQDYFDCCLIPGSYDFKGGFLPLDIGIMRFIFSIGFPYNYDIDKVGMIRIRSLQEVSCCGSNLESLQIASKNISNLF